MQSYTLAPMRTRTLGPLQISLVGLGCNNFGRRVDEPATRAVVGRALRGRRQHAVLATKFGGGGELGHGKGSREQVRDALEASLRRFQTDYLDLYQHHQEDPETPLSETIGALDEFVREGKIHATPGSRAAPSASSCRPARGSAWGSSPAPRSRTAS
jgi:aryl-alcohol dehydrogenase-like predicted oxidoreductase